jgi:hypothetical protein
MRGGFVLTTQWAKQELILHFIVIRNIDMVTEIDTRYKYMKNYLQEQK